MAGRIKARKHVQRESYPACADLYRNNPSVLSSDLTNPDAFSKDVAKHGLSLCTMPKGSPFKWGVYGEAPKIQTGLSGNADAEPVFVPEASSVTAAESGEEKTEGNLVGWLISGASALVFAGVNTLLALKILKMRAKAKAARAETEKTLAEMGKGELPPLAELPPEPALEPAPVPQPVPQPEPEPAPASLPEPVEPEPFAPPERAEAPVEELPVLDVPKVPVPKPGAAKAVPPDSTLKTFLEFFLADKPGAAKAVPPGSAPQPLPRPAYVPPPPVTSGIEESGMFDPAKGLSEQSELLDLGKLMDMHQAQSDSVPEEDFDALVTLVPKKKEKGLFERAKDGVSSAIAEVKGLFFWTKVNDSMIEEEYKSPPPLPDASEIQPLPSDLTKELSDIIAGSVERVGRLLPEAMRVSFARSIWTYESRTIEGERGALFNVMRSLIQVARMSGDQREAYHDAEGYMLESAADRVIIENSGLPMAAKLALQMRSIDEFAGMESEELHGVARRLYAQWSMMTPMSKKNVIAADWDDRNMSPARFYETYDMPPDSWLKREAKFMATEQEAWEEAAPRKSVGNLEIHAVHDALFRNEWFESARAAKRFKIAKALASVLFDPEFRSHRVQPLPSKQQAKLYDVDIYVDNDGKLTRDGILVAFERAGLGVPPVDTVIMLPGNRNEILPLPKAPDGEPVSTDGKETPAVDAPEDVDAMIEEVRGLIAKRHGGKMPIADVEELDLNEIEIIRDASEASIQLDVREMEEVRTAGEPSVQLDVSDMEELPPELGEGVGRGVDTGVTETRATQNDFASGGKPTAAGAKETVVHEKDGSRPRGPLGRLKAWAAKAGRVVEESRKK